MSKKPVKPEEDSQERLIREMISKEILKKIERRVQNNDEHVFKTVKQMISEEKDYNRK